jgi:Response regulator containing CheY-like receiver domain and AraC-type DNA-binding domain
VCRLTAAKQEANRSRDRDRQLSSFAESIQGYIEEHYEDPNLNITMIGDTFGMKATYLSKLYKDQTGEGLLDAINRTRINRAKELLRTERTSLEEAAGRSGFSSVNTFIRAFKKVEGVTPGQYKWLE